MKKHFFGGLATGVVITLFLSSVFSYSLLSKYQLQQVAETVGRTPGETSSKKLDTSAVSAKLTALDAIIGQYYLNDVDHSLMTEDIYKGALASLGDPYSTYYTKEEYKTFNEQSDGNYCGIGVSVTTNVSTGAITVVQVFKKGSAAKAGMEAGDIIYKVEGEDITGLDLSTAVSKIKGEEGTSVNLVVVRDSKEIRMNLKRTKVDVDTVTSEMLDDDIGYIKVSGFDGVTADQFDEILTNLEKKGIKGLVIDLRNNPGGRLDIVCKMLDRVLPTGLLVYIEDKYGHKEEEKAVTKKEFKKPISILINGNSASASEIFAGAMKDYKRATLVGNTTFGKGIVQQILPLTDGSAIKITVSKYYTPNGVNIHGTGIAPDIEVDLNEDAIKNGVIVKDKDNQLKEAVNKVKKDIAMTK